MAGLENPIGDPQGCQVEKSWKFWGTGGWVWGVLQTPLGMEISGGMGVQKEKPSMEGMDISGTSHCKIFL